MSDLPEGWEYAPIGALCNLVNGRAFKPQEWSSSGLPIIRIQNLNYPEAKFNFFSGELESKHHVRAGDLLFAWSGTPGTSFGAHIWNRGDAALNQHIFKIEFSDSDIDRDFLRYAINQKLDELIGSAQGGVGLRHVTKGTFEKTEIAFPPLTEQVRIAAKLGELLAQVDTLKARVDGIPVLLKHVRQSILASAVSGRLTEEWRGKNADFNVTTLGKVCAVSTGKTPKRGQADYWEGGNIPWLTSALTGTEFCSEAEQFVTVRALKECTLKLYQPGTLLMAMYGEGKTRGQVTELKIEATCNQACAAISVNETLANKDFVKIRLQENYEEVRKMAVGGAQPNLNLEKVREISICLPSMEEQAEIVRRVGQLFAFTDQLEALISVARARIERLPQSILAKAFRGELVPQEPNDEPASALLERIKAQRAAATKPKRGRKALA
ncbi:restriction endonuclease subunit S [Pseudomonas sp.]|uniref:restriction endonuclease subunit S n=1 Tax=Pseudomonas sp. TaxID=306 RepID=UPI0028AE157A|nr:restriction endonuclease subunit S [Pseudomonas sp.]